MRRADIEVPNLAGDVNSRARSACYPRGSFYPLSPVPSTREPRITLPAFRPCAGCPPCSQAPFLPMHSLGDLHPPGGNLWAPPLPFRRRPPQSNSPPGTVRRCVRVTTSAEWYFTVPSLAATTATSPGPTYPTQRSPRPNAKLE